MVALPVILRRKMMAIWQAPPNGPARRRVPWPEWLYFWYEDCGFAAGRRIRPSRAPRAAAPQIPQRALPRGDRRVRRTPRARGAHGEAGRGPRALGRDAVGARARRCATN